jgi:hypothetical protein
LWRDADHFDRTFSNIILGMLLSTKEVHKYIEGFLERLISAAPIDLEDQHLEVKSWCGTEKQLSGEVAEASVCLSNADGGIIVVGVLDKKIAPHCFKSCPHDSVDPAWIQERIEVLTRPPVVCRAYRISDLIPTLKGKPEGTIIAVDVPKTCSLELHRFEGVCYKRMIGSLFLYHL